MSVEALNQIKQMILEGQKKDQDEVKPVLEDLQHFLKISLKENYQIMDKYQKLFEFQEKENFNPKQNIQAILNLQQRCSMSAFAPKGYPDGVILRMFKFPTPFINQAANLYELAASPAAQAFEKFYTDQQVRQVENIEPTKEIKQEQNIKIQLGDNQQIELPPMPIGWKPGDPLPDNFKFPDIAQQQQVEVKDVQIPMYGEDMLDFDQIESENSQDQSSDDDEWS